MAKAFSILAALALIQVALAADIANKYTVVLKSGVSASAHRDTVHATVAKINAQPHIEGTANVKSEVHHEYSIGSFNGYSGQFSAAAVAAIKADPNVASVQVSLNTFIKCEMEN
ncbi:hypothetical protein BC828DRAFT_431170 [Blastocladiella britannica]|nr:hypothetical protein BC828DRAFT_431170 [Blastocladiella britannica]